MASQIRTHPIKILPPLTNGGLLQKQDLLLLSHTRFLAQKMCGSVSPWHANASIRETCARPSSKDRYVRPGQSGWGCVLSCCSCVGKFRFEDVSYCNPLTKVDQNQIESIKISAQEDADQRILYIILVGKICGRQLHGRNHRKFDWLERTCPM